MDPRLASLWSSPPPYYESCISPTSPGQPHREATTPDHKRRRLDLHSPHRSITDPLLPAEQSMPARTFYPYAYADHPPINDTSTQLPVSPMAYWDDETVLQHYSAFNHFVSHEMRPAVHSPSLTRYQLPGVAASASHSPWPSESSSQLPGSEPTRTTRQPSISTSPKPSAHNIFQRNPGRSYAPGPVNDFAGLIAESASIQRRTEVGPSNTSNQTIPNLVTTMAAPYPSPRTHASSDSATATTGRQVILVLSRATQESIDALPEHKRECPACQLDFEPDNFMAVISCCDAAMHATCLSAWVNSATYAKNKTCMKCRQSIDARRPLNGVVPPVSDTNWDEGVDFNAPDIMKGDSSIKVTVTPRQERFRRHIRGAYLGYRSMATGLALPDSLVPEARRNLALLQREHSTEIEAIRRRFHVACVQATRALEEDKQAQKLLSDARRDPSANPSVNIDELVKRSKVKRAAKEKWDHELQAIETLRESLRTRYARMMDDLYREHRSAPRGEVETAPAVHAAPQSG